LEVVFLQTELDSNGEEQLHQFLAALDPGEIEKLADSPTWGRFIEHHIDVCSLCDSKIRSLVRESIDIDQERIEELGRQLAERFKD